MEKIRLMIVDDHSLLRETWSIILNGHPRFKVIANCGNGEEALKLCKLLHPDIVLMDINLPGMNGVLATSQIIIDSPQTKVIGISLHNHPSFARKMMEAGAIGYITKNTSREEMVSGLLEVAEGKYYVCHEIKNILSEEMVLGRKRKTIDLLSQREREVVEWLKKGASSKVIAAELYISVKTVEIHRYNILRKLGLKNTAALIDFVNRSLE